MRRSKLTGGDLIRIPAGVLLMYASGQAVWKAWDAFDGSVVSMLVLVLTVAVAVVMLAIGAVMALGWIGAGRKRTRRR